MATEYGIAKSMISTILKYKEAIKNVDVAKDVKVLTEQQSHRTKEAEKLLLI